MQGARYWECSFVVKRHADPNLSVGDPCWVEQKVDGLMRPTARMRMKVVERNEHQDGVHYVLHRDPVTEPWLQEAA